MAFSLPGNDAGAEHHRVARLDGDVLVIIHGHARQRRHRLALRARDQHGHFVAAAIHHVLRPDQNAVGNVQQAQRMRDFGDADHAAADDRDLAAELLREIRISWMRWMEELKQEIISRLSARLKMSSMRGRTARSDSV